MTYFELIFVKGIGLSTPRLIFIKLYIDIELSDWTQVSCIAGRLSTFWATREGHMRGLTENKCLMVMGFFLGW